MFTIMKVCLTVLFIQKLEPSCEILIVQKECRDNPNTPLSLTYCISASRLLSILKLHFKKQIFNFHPKLNFECINDKGIERERATLILI